MRLRPRPKLLGAEIRTDAEVQTIKIENGRARGVVLRSGEEFDAPLIASNLDPKRTFLRLVDQRHLDAEFLDQIHKYRCEGTSIKINLAVSALPEFSCTAGYAGAAASRDHAYLSRHRLCREGMGRREIWAAIQVTLIWN